LDNTPELVEATGDAAMDDPELLVQRRSVELATTYDYL
jgi:hypothetical protein